MSGTIPLKIVVADDAALSEAVSVAGDGSLVHCAVAGIECPDAVTGTDATLEYSRDGGTTWCKVSVDGAPVVVKIASADGNGVKTFAAVNPAHHFALGTQFRLRCTDDQAADREFKLVLGDVVSQR